MATINSPRLIRKTQLIAASGDTTVIDISVEGANYSGTPAVLLKGVRIQNKSGNAQRILLKEGAVTKESVDTNSDSSGIDKEYPEDWVFPPSVDFIVNADTADSFSLTTIYMIRSS